MLKTSKAHKTHTNKRNTTKFKNKHNNKQTAKND